MGGTQTEIHSQSLNHDYKAMVLHHVKTFYSKHQQLALMDQSPVFSFVLCFLGKLKKRKVYWLIFGGYENKMFIKKVGF